MSVMSCIEAIVMSHSAALLAVIRAPPSPPPLDVPVSYMPHLLQNVNLGRICGLQKRNLQTLHCGNRFCLLMTGTAAAVNTTDGCQWV